MARPRGSKNKTNYNVIKLKPIKKKQVEKEYVCKTQKDIAQDAPLRAGKREFITALSKKKQAASQAIKAKCFDCMGYYLDGANDCGMHSCPLYPWMPYGEGKGWFEKSRRGRKKDD